MIRRENILVAHRHENPPCAHEIRHTSCESEHMGAALPHGCEPEYPPDPDSINICRHTLNPDGKMIHAIESDPLKSAFNVIAGWAAENDYEVTFLFTHNNGYWDYDMTGEE